MSEQVDEKPEASPIEEAFAHLERCKRILEEWEEMEKLLEAEQTKVVVNVER